MDISVVNINFFYWCFMLKHFIDYILSLYRDVFTFFVVDALICQIGSHTDLIDSLSNQNHNEKSYSVITNDWKDPGEVLENSVMDSMMIIHYSSNVYLFIMKFALSYQKWQ